MITAANVSRAIRQPGYRLPSVLDEPPVFMVLPTTIARRAVRAFHEKGATAAITYVSESKLGEWANHTNPSMASGARNVINGVVEYTKAATADGRKNVRLDQKTVVKLKAGPVEVSIDVVLADGNDIAGRVVMWDGPDFEPEDAPLIAAVYSQGLQQLYPKRTITSIGVWQGRRQSRAEVAFGDAQAQLKKSSRVLGDLS
jgi:hypothetical protein